MSFILPDLVIESVLRAGLDNIQANPDLIDDIFGTLESSYISTKYGTAELARIKAKLVNDVSVVHSFHEVEAKAPCISIQLMQDGEDVKMATLDDFHGDLEEDITDPGELAALEIISDFTPTGYDTTQKIVSVDDSVDLSLVYANLVFEDVDLDEFVITGGIDNTPGQKQFRINGNTTPNIAGLCNIKSGLDYTLTEVRGVFSNVQILLGIHSKEPLFTKYLYILIKYFILSSKKELNERCFITTSYQGSDFTRNFEYGADLVYTRFLTITGRVEDSWKTDVIPQIDSVATSIYVDRDVADTATLGLTDSTIQVDDT